MYLKCNVFWNVTILSIKVMEIKIKYYQLKIYLDEIKP